VPLVNGKLNGKYRQLLKPFEQLKAEADLLTLNLKTLQQEHQQSSTNDAQLTQTFIRIFAEHRTRKNWPQIPGMPGMIETILNDWLAGRADLRLTENPVSAEAMLRAQAEGWRYVTVSFNHALAGEPIEGDRDAFEFALHDLGHAYAFFKADYHPQGQVEFFAALLNDTDTLAPYAVSDVKFAGDLEYCMADMNSHPQHLAEYLRGVIVEMFLRRRAETGESEQHNEAELDALLARLSCLKNLQPRTASARRNHPHLDRE
jgi:hypothetical protein